MNIGSNVKDVIPDIANIDLVLDIIYFCLDDKGRIIGEFPAELVMMGQLIKENR